MPKAADKNIFLVTLQTLAVGGLGAGLAHWLSFPVFILTGPAILVAVAALFGMRFSIYPPLWDAALLIVGISIGASVNDQTTAALIRWPSIFAVLGVALAAIILTSRALLVHGLGYSKIGATLAATPGHLSFVLGLAVDLKQDIARISTVQAVRLLSLTLLVPFGARAFGMDMGRALFSTDENMAISHILLLFGAGLALGIVFRKLRLPAPFLIGGLLASALSHVTDLTPGEVFPQLSLLGFLVVGTMIGTRFSGVSPSQLRRDGLAGIFCTGVAVGFASLAAWPVSIYLDMPILHVLVAFSPGGLETMMAMGAVLGADPGFITAAHIARLLILLILLPIFLGRSKGTN